MNHDNVPLETDDQLGALGKAFVSRGEAGADALRDLLQNQHEHVQLNAACWLSELDPCAANMTLKRLEREAVDPAIGMIADLKLIHNRDRGLLPADS